jgi:hypothetical protein
MIRLLCVVSQGVVCIACEVRTLDYLALDVTSPKRSRAPHIPEVSSPELRSNDA